MSSIYIDDAQKRIYFDNSTAITFDACKEKSRLQNVRGYRLREPGKTSLALDFGHAWHAGIAAYYDALAGGFFDSEMKWHMFPIGAAPSLVRLAQTAFMEDVKRQESKMQLTIESDDRRSLERGIMLLEAYLERWKNEPYENILRPDGSPLTELYFEIPIAQYQEWTIYYCGTIDRIMKQIIVSRPVIFETKTTTKPLFMFIEERKPNAQIDSYFKIAWQYMLDNFPDLPEIREAVWDATFVSDRKPDMAKALKNRFWMWGIRQYDEGKDKLDKGDFARQTTSRSKTDIAEFMIDLEEKAVQFAKWLLADVARWPRSKSSTTCHLFNGCQFRNVCNVNGDNSMLETFYEVKPWNPRKPLRQL